MDIQARIPMALCAIHNYIRIHDPAEAESDLVGDTPAEFFVDDNDHSGSGGADVFPQAAEGLVAGEASLRHDQIARAMWDDYLHVLAERGLDDNSESGTSDFDFDFNDDDDDNDVLV